MQTWGTSSVTDHLGPRAFVTDVILYDRLVIPVPDAKERKRWADIGRRPDVLTTSLTSSRSLLAVPRTALLSALTGPRTSGERSIGPIENMAAHVAGTTPLILHGQMPSTVTSCRSWREAAHWARCPHRKSCRPTPRTVPWTRISSLTRFPLDRSPGRTIALLAQSDGNSSSPRTRLWMTTAF